MDVISYALICSKKTHEVRFYTFTVSQATVKSETRWRSYMLQPQIDKKMPDFSRDTVTV